MPSPGGAHHQESHAAAIKLVTGPVWLGRRWTWGVGEAGQPWPGREGKGSAGGGNRGGGENVIGKEGEVTFGEKLAAAEGARLSLYPRRRSLA